MDGQRDSFARGLSRPHPGPWERADCVPERWETETLRACIASGAVFSQAAIAAAAATVLAEYLRADNVRIAVHGAGGAPGRTLELKSLPDESGASAITRVARALQVAPLAVRNGEADAVVIVREAGGAPHLPAETSGARLAIECDERLAGAVVHYRSGAHAGWLAEQFGSHVLRRLAQLLASPDAAIAHLPLLDPAEWEELERAATGPVRSYDLDFSLDARFRARAAASPDRVALIVEREPGMATQLTYLQVDAAVDRLAGRLRAAGARGTRVGVYLHRSADAAIALLAVLRSGAVYVPLERAFPRDYLRFILEDAGARLVITEREGAGLPREAGLTALLLDGDDASCATPAAANPEPATSEPALVFYTSGSTGRPKGVIHAQRQVINRLEWMWETYPFAAGDVLAQRSPLGVMPSMWEQLGGLLAGIPTVILPDAAGDPLAFARCLERHRVSFMTVTPTVLRLMLDATAADGAAMPPLRVVVIGGEPVPPDLRARFHARCPDATLVDDFGATEVNTMMHAPSRAAADRADYRPIANVRARFLDDRLRVVPRGVEGELCVSGVPLALSYLDRPDETARRFVPVAGDAAGSVTYRTGDMGYVARDGALVMTGRRDQQVKINGFRVELGEIERALSQHPRVARCAVVARVAGGRARLVAGVTSRDGAPLEETDLRAFLGSRLPQYMVPAFFEQAAELPQRPNGKLDRQALGRVDPLAIPIDRLSQIAAEVLGLEPSSIRCDEEFVVLGFDSVAIADFANRLSRELAAPFSPVTLYDHPSVARLAAHLARPDADSSAAPHVPHRFGEDAVAIVGMSGQFAGASGIDELWRALCDGRVSVGTEAPGRWSADAIYDPDPANPGGSTSKWGAFLDGVDQFDPAFFGLSAAEARLLDPQHRLCLLEAWRTLEDGGYTGVDAKRHRIGVFLGSRESDYRMLIERAGLPATPESLLGNDLGLTASRISHFLDLRGPSLVVDTNCSSGLVAIHLACRSLRDGECTMALAGGVCVTNDPGFYIGTSKLGVFSPSGRCRAFDAEADGFVHGEGVAFVLLKRLDDAMADGDRVYAVIRGTAINQDGRSNGIAAPNGDAQAELQESLYRRIGIDPATITYVEAHGTGTRLGDPIEVQALTRSFRRFTDRTGYCAIGSLKANVGHATAAAGVAGIIKAALCLHHRRLVPTPGFTSPNPWIDFDSSPFYVATDCRPWQAPDGVPRRAAINSFGIGGTNAHAVLEEAPAVTAAAAPPQSGYPVPVTARRADAVHDALRALDAWLTEHEEADLRDVSLTLASGRRVFEHGLLFLARDMAHLRARVREALEGGGAGATPITPDAPFAPDAYARDPGARRIRLPGCRLDLDRYWIDAPEPRVATRESLDSRELPPAPASTPEETLVAAVAELLEIDVGDVSRDTSLSVQGFDSVRAIALKSILDRRCGVDVPLSMLLGGSGTLTQLADQIAALQPSRGGEPDDPWRTAGEPHEPFPLTDLQSAHFVAKHMPDADPAGAHVYVEFVVPGLDIERLEGAWLRVLEIHPMLRARVDAAGVQRIPEDMPRVSFPRYAPDVDWQLHLDRTRAEMSHKVYSPGTWPLWDIRVTGGPEGDRVHVSMDSWIVDGASAELVHAQWRRLYEEPGTAIAAPGAAFRDYVVNAIRFDGSDEHRRSVEYWSRKLEACPPPPALPESHARPVSTGRRRILETVWSREQWTPLRASLSSAGLSPSATMLGLFVEHLRMCGCGSQSSLAVTLYNRPARHPDIHRVVGPFSSSGIFIAPSDREGSLLDRLRACQAQLVQDLEHGFAPGASALRVAEGHRADPASVVFTSTIGIEATESSWLDLVDYRTSQTPGVRLHVHVEQRHGALRLAWEIAEGHTRADVMEGLFDGWCLVIDNLIEQGLDGISDLFLCAKRASYRSAIERAGSPAVAPLTPLQQSYLASRVLASREPPFVYREIEYGSASGAPLDVARLQAALDTMAAGSDALRSTVDLGRALMRDTPDPPPSIQIRPLDEEGAQAGGAAFDGGQAAVVCAGRCAGGAGRLQILLDPMRFDGYATWAFIHELLARYEGRYAAAPARTGFLAFAAARSDYAATPLGAADRWYWEQRVRGLPPGPPTDTLDGPEAPVRRTATIDAWPKLSAAARARGLDPAALLAAVYAEGLRRVTRRPALTIAVAEYGLREILPEFSSAYGDFSSLCLLSYAENGETLEDAVGAAARALAQDRAHEWGNPLEPLRASQAGPVRAVFTNCLSAPSPIGAATTEVTARSHTPGVVLDHVVSLDGVGFLRAAWQASGGAIAPRLDALVREQRAMLDSLSDDAAWSCRIADLGKEAGRPLAERQPWNDTDRDYDRTVCVHTLVETVARRHPNRIALVTATGTMTYGELDGRANRLAHHLRRAGVEPGARVGVLLERSFDLVVTVIAALKAGAAFVPLPASDPPARIAAMLSAAEVRVVVTKSGLAARVTSASVIVLDSRETRERTSDEDGAAPPRIDMTADAIAYVIFTSGSTGAPKGVVVQHRPVVNLIDWGARTFAFNERDRVLFVNPLGFDLAVFDIFGLLAAGGSIRIASDEESKDPAVLARLLVDGSVTFWNSAPAYMQFVLPALQARREQGASLRLAFLSGDWIPLAQPDQLRSIFPALRVVALGGATEATVWSNWFDVGPVDPRWASIPYGKPIQNARYYALDESGRPSPDGVRGELYIGGECVALGYAGAADLTRERFVPDPFHERPGMRMYRTGDFVRVMDDGNLEFLGRVDTQVKLRGFRIELGEVEAALARAGLASPVAVVREETPGNPVLVAFGIGGGSEPLLLQRVAAHLPPSMVPSRIHTIASLPMTAHGKVDRRRLLSAPIDELLTASQCAGSRGGAAGSGDASAGELEAFVCDTMADILGIPAVEVDTHFSMLGVSSLHFALLSVRIAERIGRPMSPAKLFAFNSAGEIAHALAEQPVEGMPAAASAPRHGDLAVTGLSCVVPGAADAETFWSNIEQGRSSISVVPAERWDARALAADPAVADAPVADRAGFIADIDRFDPAFFGLSPREAALMDPRQRLLLEGVWKTLEDAGQRPSALRGERIGVFIGALGDEYASLLERSGEAVDHLLLTGNARSLLTNRVSYYFAWHGPSEVVDTTCSSSLVALHNAARAIAAGDCTMAIVGGVNILIDPRPHVCLARTGVLSPDGVCRAFDAGANGYVRGEGLGLILVRPLADAEAAGDRVRAVICGTAVNHGGRANSLTAPNPRAQARVIADALERSGLSPAQIGYVEAHGTGTVLGDPIEIDGLRAAFQLASAAQGGHLPASARISIGSVKANVGHLEGAAGIVGLIKVILMLERRVIPPLAYLHQLNPAIDAEGTPFCFDTAARPWNTPRDPSGSTLLRAAGISSFGFGGVNAHAVIREAPPRPRPPGVPPPFVCPLSAHSDVALRERAHGLAAFLENRAHAPDLQDVAWTLQFGRDAFGHRAAVVASSVEHLVRALHGIARGEAPAAAAPGQAGGGPSEALAAAFVAGASIDWSSLWPVGAAPRRLSLPAYPFARVRCWAPSLAAPRERQPALVPDGGSNFTITLDGESFRLADHVVNGVAILPAAAYVEIMAAVAERLAVGAPWTIANICWMRPLRLAGQTPVRARIDAERTRGGWHLTIADADRRSSEYATADISAAPEAAPAPVDIHAVLQRCTTTSSRDACYSRLASAGLAFGPALRTLGALHSGAREAIAALADGVDRAGLTASVDAAFQTAMLHDLADRAAGPLLAPFAAGRVCLFDDIARAKYAYVQRIEGRRPSQASAAHHLALLDAGGRVLLRVSGCTAVRMADGSPRASDTRVYREEWQTLRPIEIAGVRPDGSSHLTIGAPAVAEALHASGARVLANVVVPRQGGGAVLTGPAVRWEDLDQPGATSDFRLWYDGGSLAALSADEQLRYTFETVADLAGRLMRSSAAGARVTLIALGAADNDVPPAVSALAGLARVARAEHPGVRVAVVRAISRAPARNAGDLARAITAAIDAAPDAIEHRLDLSSGLHAVRALVPQARTPVRALPIRPGSVYLVAGGAGAIGRHVARAVSQAAASVALLGRSAMPDRSVHDIEGARYFRADITDPAALARAIEEVRRTMGDIRGVFHCAGEVAGGLLVHPPSDAVRRVLRGPIHGTLGLDHATADSPLDFFALCSSVAAEIGPVGLGAYAYASGFTAAYADCRAELVRQGARRGVTVTVSWPVWREGGMRVPPGDLAHLQSRGLWPIATADALEVLASCLGGGGHFVCLTGEAGKFEPYLGVKAAAEQTA